VLIKDRKLLCANVGDSRAVLAKRVSATDWKAMPLSRDHKPTLETEKLRILKHGGRIDTQKDF
jgi:serine/threonine protein phosphatase PrpC